MRGAVLMLLLTACAADRDMPPLVAAARGGDAAAIRQLLQNGADPNAPYGTLAWTPLMHAIDEHQTGAVAALLESGADANKTFNFESEPRTMQRRVTPLMMAAGYGESDVVALLLRHGADPARVDGDGNRALDYAYTGALYRSTLLTCQDDVVRALIAAHAPPVIAGGTRKAAKVKRCATLALLR